MIDKIATIILQSSNLKIESRFDLNEELLAQEILDCIENNGMYPPDTIKEKHIVSEWDSE